MIKPPVVPRHPAQRILLALLVPFAIAALWEIAARRQWLPSSVFASLADTIRALWQLLLSGHLLQHAGISLARLAFGCLLGVTVGLLIGVLIGASKTWERLLNPTISFLLPVPPIAWIPFFIVMFGISGSRIALIAAGTFLFVATATASGIRSISKDLIEVAELYEYRGPQLVIKVLLPGAVTEILGGIRAGVGISWVLLVASELIASSSGIGWLMWNSRNFSRPADMLAACVSIALLGVSVDSALACVQRRLSTWRTSFTGQ